MISSVRTEAIAAQLAALTQYERAEVLGEGIATIADLDALRFLEESVLDAALATDPAATITRPEAATLTCPGCPKELTELQRWDRPLEPVSTWRINTSTRSLEAGRDAGLMAGVAWFTPCCRMEVELGESWDLTHG